MKIEAGREFHRVGNKEEETVTESIISSFGKLFILDCMQTYHTVCMYLCTYACVRSSINTSSAGGTVMVQKMTLTSPIPVFKGLIIPSGCESAHPSVSQ